MDEWIKKWGRKSDQQREESMRLMIHEYGEYFLQQDLNEDESAMTIMLNIAKWGTKSTNRLYFLPKYRYYYPLLSLTCEIAILPLRILILTSFDQIVLKNEDYDFLNIVTTHTRFQEVKDLIYKVDYLLYDKLDFDAEFCYGAIFSEDSLQAAVFISRENIYIYHSPQSSLNSNQLHILIITVINDWLSNHQLSSLFGVVKVSDDVLANTLQNIGFRSPHGNDENIFDELIVFPSSDVPGAASTTPEEIFLLMGQSNMSGRGSLLGPTGFISTASECSNLHEVVQNVQRQLDSLSDVNCHKDIFYAKEGGLEIRYSEHYDERIQTFDIQSKQWRLKYFAFIF